MVNARVKPVNVIARDARPKQQVGSFNNSVQKTTVKNDSGFILVGVNLAGLP
jgi:hypothetical protein